MSKNNSHTMQTEAKDWEELYKRIFDNALEGIFQSSTEGIYLNVNPAFARIHGFDSPQVMINEISDIGKELYVNPDERKKILRIIQDKGCVEGYELELKKKNGEKFWILLNAYSVKDLNGKILHLEGTSIDITKRKHTERQLMESQVIFNQLADNVDMMINIYDIASRQFIYANKNFENYFGESCSKIKEASHLGLKYIHPDDLPIIQTIHAKKSKKYEYEFRIILQDKKIKWLRNRSFPVFDNNGNECRLINLTSDITIQKASEEQEKLHAQQIIQTDKMATLGILASGVAHEINNPNNAILLSASILGKAWKSLFPVLEKYSEETGNEIMIGAVSYSEFKENFPKIMQGIMESSARIKRIVSELKEYAIPDAYNGKQAVNMNHVIKSAVKLLEPMIRKKTKFFSMHLCEEPIIFKGSFQKMEQVLINILQNSCDSLQSPEKHISIISSCIDKKYMKVLIKDEGTGITPENIEKIFDPFFTTKRAQGGTGLGLAVSKDIIKIHGGEIKFDSESGKGTNVHIVLPIINR
jgi:PAS domain S-box-containing protein